MKKMISRRNFLAAAGVVAAAGVLTACGGSSNSTAASASTAASGAAAFGDTLKQQLPAAVLPPALQVLQPVPLPVLPLPAAPSRWA